MKQSIINTVAITSLILLSNSAFADGRAEFQELILKKPSIVEPKFKDGGKQLDRKSKGSCSDAHIFCKIEGIKGES